MTAEKYKELSLNNFQINRLHIILERLYSKYRQTSWPKTSIWTSNNGFKQTWENSIQRNQRKTAM